MRSLRVVLSMVAVLTPCQVFPVAGQTITMAKNETATVLGRVGSSLLLEAEGPPLSTTTRKSLKYKWYMIQDSSLGVVFTEPSGVKATAGDLYDGDIDLLTSSGVRAVEIRSLVFNVWQEYRKTLSATYIDYRDAGTRWSYNPRWSDLYAPNDEHLTSIMFIARILTLDGRIVEAPLDPLYELVKRVWGKARAEDLMASKPTTTARAPGSPSVTTVAGVQVER